MSCYTFLYPTLWTEKRLRTPVRKSCSFAKQQAIIAECKIIPDLVRRRAPRTFVRLFHDKDDVFLLQTSVTTYLSPQEKDTQTLDLHALLHLDDAL